MTFWQPVLVLLRVRHQVARNALARNSTAFMSSFVFGCLLALAALGMGQTVGAQWSALSVAGAQHRLQQMWLLMQVLWVLALLLPGGIALLGRMPPRSALRPFALLPAHVLAAETLAALLDVPALLALLLTLPLAGHLLLEGQWAQALVALLALALLGLQTGLLAWLIAYMASCCTRRLRRLAEIPAWATLLLFCLCAGMPPAFASLSNPSSHNAKEFPARLLSSPAVDLASMMPSGIAVDAVAAAREADVPKTIGALGVLTAYLGLTWCGAMLALRGANAFQAEYDGRAPARPAHKINASGASRTGALAQLRAAMVTEWRLLLRKPSTYLPLRQPATLLLFGACVFVSPDMSRDAVYNLKEYAGMGLLLYSVLWQMQLLCNRFGTEAGTGALLFGLSISRRRLLLAKNLALFCLLLLLDSAEGIGLSVIAGMPLHIPTFLLWLPLILLVLTALGNLISVVQPFAIARQERGGVGEPLDTLATIYVLVGCAAAMLLAPVSALAAHGLLGMIAAGIYMGVPYGASLFVSGALLARREQMMIGRLDRNE